MNTRTVEEASRLVHRRVKVQIPPRSSKHSPDRLTLMNMTALRIEILTIGVQGIVCLLFLFYSDIFLIWQQLSPDEFNRISNFIAPATVLFIGLIYTIGVIIDGFTAIIDDALPYCVENLFSPDKKMKIHKYPDTSILRLEHRETYEDILRYDFDLRLLRSTCFNVIIFTLLLFNLRQYPATWIAIGVSALVLVAWLRRRNRRGRRTLRLLASLRLGNKDDGPVNTDGRPS